MSNFSQQPIKIEKKENHYVHVFNLGSKNIQADTIESFGEEWKKFYQFNESEIKKSGDQYFDIINPDMLNNAYVLDVGGGTGRWSKYLIDHFNPKFIEILEPSDAIYSAEKLLKDYKNVRLINSSVGNIPFEDETFDFVMSVGVLHHIPNTEAGIIDCVKKLKKGGHFYVYLYYNLDNKGLVFKLLFALTDFIRKIVSSLPQKAKELVCDFLAIVAYYPVILIGRFIKFFGFKSLAASLPLSSYQDKSWFIIRSNALDRFGTNLEQRFSKEQIISMLKKAGLSGIVVGEKIPFYHVIGRK